MPAFACPHCGRQGTSRPRAVAAQVRCRGCNGSFVIPATPAPPPTAVVAPPAPPPPVTFHLPESPQPSSPGGVVSFFWLVVAVGACAPVAVMAYLALKVVTSGADPALLLLVPLNPLVLALLVLLTPFVLLALAVDRMGR